MADVFISFSTLDTERVERIHDNLIERGFDVWWMRNLLPGDSALQTVSRELAGARRVVLAWSRHAAESPYVEGEIMHAFGARKLVPVRIEKWAWPAFLSSVQYIDMTATEDEAEAWRQVEARLRQTRQFDAPRLAGRLIAAPRSAGPVLLLAAMMLLLVFALMAALRIGFQAIQDGDLQMLQLVQYSILALPALSAAMVLVASQRVWGAWRSRPARIERVAR
jgi:hypothetical protein